MCARPPVVSVRTIEALIVFPGAEMPRGDVREGAKHRAAVTALSDGK